MFKLLKDLTRLPEPLTPSPQPSALSTPTVPYAARERRRSISNVTTPLLNSSIPPSLPKSQSSDPPSLVQPITKVEEEEEVKETNEDAIRVVELIKSLQKVTEGLSAEDEASFAGYMMQYIENFAQILSVRAHFLSRRAFRRHKGFETLLGAMDKGMYWRKQPSNAIDEEWQVLEVQRSEGLRLAFEVLAWATADRPGLTYFEKQGGYMSLLPILRQISPHTTDSDPTSHGQTPGEVFVTSPGPTSKMFNLSTPQIYGPILGLLLSHMLNNNYSLLTLFADSESPTFSSDSATLEDKIGPDLHLRPTANLRLLWTFLWGLDGTLSSCSKNSDQETLNQISTGCFEGNDNPTGRRAQLIELTFRVINTAIHASTGNLFLVHNQLPELIDFLLARLYGLESSRKYEVTFPARDDWYQPSEQVVSRSQEWVSPAPRLRVIYLSMLRRMLEAGITQQQSWRLFELVRLVPKAASRPPSLGSTSPAPSSGAETPCAGTPPPKEAEGSKAFRGKTPLKLVVPSPTVPLGLETLQGEVLDLIQHAMKIRWPDVFVFRGGKDNAAGGLQLNDLGRPWMQAAKGFTFSCWLYISKLNEAITIFHLSQKDSHHPLFRIRILENSQIGLYSSVHKPTSSVMPEESTEDDSYAHEVVCSAPDALIPHHQWVHFTLGCRRGRSTSHAEARIYVDGRRVGAVRIMYPVPMPPSVSVSGTGKVSPTEGIRASFGCEYVREDKLVVSEGIDTLGRAEDNEWMLGRTLLLEETISEDLVMLMHHLGPRYYGNMQEPLGKFLTYEGATSINVYLSSVAQSAAEKKATLSPNNSSLVRAIRTGPAIHEDNVVLSLSPKDVLPPSDPKCSSDSVMNSAIPHVTRTRAFRHGVASMIGNVYGHSSCSLDEAVSAVGGGVIILKLIDMAKDSNELAITLTILRDMIKDSWSASEEMERIHGFELLAAILRPKMVQTVDINCTKIILSMLGISPDKASTATVVNSTAYRSIGLEFEIWALAPLGVVSLYFQHFDYLLTTSKHKRFNLLRTFQKSNVVRKLLYTIRTGLFEPTVVPLAVDALRLILVSRWSSEDGIKPIFSYLVSALCQGSSTGVITPAPHQPPSPPQLPAAQVFAMVAEVLHNAPRLIKLNKSLSLHRLLVVFLQSNPMPHVALPCLDILENCLTTPGLESFQRSFESEGGFALLAKTLANIWTERIQKTIFKIILGPAGVSATSLLCPAGMASIVAALDQLLQASGEDESINRPIHGRTRSGTITSLRSMAVTTLDADADDEFDDDRLERLLVELTRVYRASPPFRRGLTVRRIETMLPNLADYAAVSGASARPDLVKSTRLAALGWLNALIDLSKAPSNIINQLKLIAEQLNNPTPSPRIPSSPSLSRSPMSPSTRSATSFFGSSIGNRFGTSPSAAFSPSTPRRRPSTDSTMSLYRSRSGIEKRTPLQRVLTGESILAEEKDKNSAWKMIILQTDAQRHTTMMLDRKDHWNKLSQMEWPRQVAALRAENGVWAEEGEPVTWRIDGSEGPLRMRNRLERINAVPEQGMAKTRQKLRDAIPSADELSSAASRVNSAPWEDPFALALGDAAPIAEEEGSSAISKTSASATVPGQEGQEGIDNESYVDVEEEKSDKMRRISKTLEAGDVVEEAHNIVRIVGVDACPGLLILGKRNLYLIDGLVQTPEGQIIEAAQAPQDVLSIPSGTLVELDTADQLNYRWLYNEIVESNKRNFLFRDVALELYFSDKRNFLIVFKDKKQRQAIVQKLAAKVDHRDAISRSVIGNFVLDTVAKAIDKSESQLESMTRRWQNREISNFAYLQLLNQHSNRTPNDVTQYPVFPWVLSDYTSQTLDLNNPASFRDLSLPMGALTPARREAAAERYSATEGVGEKPFHYGTHYTSSMIVCGFMIRLSPFTEIFLALQGGNFDLADRLFSSIPRAWDSASNDNRGDVRELIPEFYYSPAFLVNVNHHDFGRKQVSGDAVDDVVLPPWALDDPLLFTHLHRDALESDYVSRHLPQWIDLTFGYKQRDPASFNCFHPLSYRGAVDLEQMEDDNEKAASTAIIHNFGQTPLQIFRSPHPSRFMSGRTSLPVGTRFGAAEHWQLLLRSILPITETTTPIDDIIPASSFPEAKPGTQQRYRLIVPGHPQLSVQFGFADQSLRVYYQDSTPRMVSIVEGIAATHAVFAAPTLVITVSPLGVLTAWRLTVKGLGYKRGEVILQREATLRGHNRPITCLAVSTAWSLLVSGSEDGVAFVWDMNRLRYIRALQTPGCKPLKMAAINEADGHIALATARSLYLFTLNGHPIASTSLHNSSLPTFSFGEHASPPSDDLEFTGSITFLHREFLKWGDLFVVGVGSQLALYRCLPGVRRFEDQAISPWKIVEQGRLHRSVDVPSSEVAVVRFIGETLYAAFKPKEGNHKYALYQWSLPEGNARHVPESIGQCMADGCSRQFGLLEPRRHCGGCGGVFCGTHCVHVESFGMRYCETCRARLSEATALGVLPSSRRGSVFYQAATGAGSGSRPGSRRGSVLLHPHDNGRVSDTTGSSRSTSQPPSVARVSATGMSINSSESPISVKNPRISFTDATTVDPQVTSPTAQALTAEGEVDVDNNTVERTNGQTKGSE